MGDKPEHGYWDSVAAEITPKDLSVLWRDWADGLNSKIVRQLLPPRCFRLLKTDAFDEAVAGGVYPALAEVADRVVLLDVSSAVLRAASRKYGAPLAQADVRRLPFADASFDAVVSLSTLDHFRSSEQIDRALAEVARILKPGGALVITMDNKANPLIWLRNSLSFGLLRGMKLVPYRVGATLTSKGLVRAVRSAGFTVLAECALVHFPRVLAVGLCKIAERVGGRRVTWRILSAFEAFGSMPTRNLTGHYVAVRAVKAS